MVGLKWLIVGSSDCVRLCLCVIRYRMVVFLGVLCGLSVLCWKVVVRKLFCSMCGFRVI